MRWNILCLPNLLPLFHGDWVGTPWPLKKLNVNLLPFSVPMWKATAASWERRRFLPLKPYPPIGGDEDLIQQFDGRIVDASGIASSLNSPAWWMRFSVPWMSKKNLGPEMPSYLRIEGWNFGLELILGCYSGENNIYGDGVNIAARCRPLQREEGSVSPELLLITSRINSS